MLARYFNRSRDKKQELKQACDFHEKTHRFMKEELISLWSL